MRASTVVTYGRNRTVAVHIGELFTILDLFRDRK